MAFEKNRVRAALLALPLAVGLSFGAATAAHATEDAQEDPRATSYTGQENASTCADVDLDGELIAYLDEDKGEKTDLIEYERGKLNDNRYLDILSVDPGVEVTGIVVKGGDGYNVYIPGEAGDGGEALSDTAPWRNLQSPLKNDKVPQISHWYICGSYTAPTTTTTTSETTTTTTTETSETSTTPPETTSSTSDETTTSETSELTSTSIVDTAPPSESTTSEAPVVDNASDNDDLAVTGFGSSWLIWAGVLFVLAGVGAIAGVRVLRKQ